MKLGDTENSALPGGSQKESKPGGGTFFVPQPQFRTTNNACSQGPNIYD